MALATFASVAVCPTPAHAEKVTILPGSTATGEYCEVGYEVDDDRGDFLGCAVDWFGGGGGGGSGSGGGGTSIPGGGGTPVGLPIKNIPKWDNNPVQATCSSPDGQRFHYAMDAAIHYREDHSYSLKVGMQLVIHYDGGGYEMWTVTEPYFTNPISNVPVPGSLHCPIPT